MYIHYILIIYIVYLNIYIYINIYINIVTSWRQSNAQLRLAQYSQVRLARLFPSDTGTIVSKWYWHNFSQVTLAQLFPSDTDTIVCKWDWHNCSHVRPARLFRSELAPLFPSEFWLSVLYFVLQFFLWHDSSLVSFTWEELCHVPGFIRECYFAGFQFAFPRKSLTRK